MNDDLLKSYTYGFYLDGKEDGRQEGRIEAKLEFKTALERLALKHNTSIEALLDIMNLVQET